MIAEQTSAHTADVVFERLLKERYSCRAYLPRPVETAKIRRILEIAQRTPSWCNAQPWKVIITRGAGTERFRGEIFSYAASNAGEPDFPFPREYLGVYLERRRECGFQLYQSVGVKRGDREAGARQGMENFRLFGAPHAMIVTTEEALGVYGVLDCGAWVNNFMLAARSLGVASIAQAAIARQSRFVRSYFQLQEERRVVCGMSFGYEDAAHPVNSFRTSRAAIDDGLVTWVDD